MKFITSMITAVLTAGLGLLASAVAALALDATSNTWLNVRSGPGTGYAVVDALYPGEQVTIVECNASSWCRIDHEGADGWVNSSYLSPVSGSGGGAPTPDCRFELTIGPGGPSLSIVCDGGGLPVPPTPPGPNQACFYDGPNFTGASFCRGVGTYATLPAWANDKITSVQLYGAARVRLCENTNMGPFCRDVTTSENALGVYLNNRVSSLRVYTGSLPPLKQACFFDGANYTGDHFCMRVGTVNILPPAANNRISSVMVFGGATARLCDNPNLVPFCRNITTNEPVLGIFLNNRASSARVY